MSAAAGAIKGASRLAAAPLGGGPDHRIDRIGQPIAAQCALRRLHVARTALTDGGATIFASAICAYPTAARSRGLSRKRAAVVDLHDAADDLGAEVGELATLAG